MNESYQLNIKLITPQPIKLFITNISVLDYRNRIEFRKSKFKNYK